MLLLMSSYAVSGAPAAPIYARNQATAVPRNNSAVAVERKDNAVGVPRREASEEA